MSDSARVMLLVTLSKGYQYVDFNKSRQFAEEAVSTAEEANPEVLKTIAYQNISNLLSISGDYSSALKYDNLSLKNSLTHADSVNLTIDYSNIANDYLDLGEYDEAYYYFTQSYRLAQHTNDSLRIAIALHNIGRVFKELGQYDQALKHLDLAQQLSYRINDYEGIAYYYDEVGDVLLRQGKYDTALKVLMRSLGQIRLQNLGVLEPRTLTKIANTYLFNNDFKNALAYYDSTYRLHERTNNYFGIAEVELGRGVVYMKQRKYDEALKFINHSLELAIAHNARVLETRCYNRLSDLWENKGNYARALEYFKLFKQLEDSIFSQEMQAKLLRDQVRFETEAKDSEIAQLSRLQDIKDDQIKKQEFIRNILVVVMALSVILLATVYRSGQRRRQINMLLLKHQEEMEKRSEELERLNQVKDKFFSIISHDLRSPINALSGLLDLLDRGALPQEEFPKHINELRTRFNHTRTLLNNLLDWTLLQMDKLNVQASKIELRKIVEENVQLLGHAQNKKIQLINDVPPGTYAYADANTINLVIRNLMTNAIKFTNDGGIVQVATEEKEDEWVVCVTDNGIGINPDVLKILFDKTAPYTTRGTANEKGTGLGLILCKEFVEKNGGKISVESEAGKGSTFRFTVPKYPNN